MPRLAADSGIDLLELNYAVNKSAFELLQDLIVGKKEVKICKFLDSRDKSANELSKKLNKIFRKDRLITEERGAKDLYVGYPFVHGTFPEGIPVRCPLVLFPVDIEIQDGSDMYWKLVKKKDTLPILNKSFLLAYSHFNHVKIDDTWLDFQFEDTFEDALSFKIYINNF